MKTPQEKLELGYKRIAIVSMIGRLYHYFLYSFEGQFFLSQKFVTKNNETNIQHRRPSHMHFNTK